MARMDKAMPIGAECVRKGYVYVKVGERPSKPGTKDNWRPKQVVAWEEAHGRSLPDGHVVMFADHDDRNFDTGNLVAVPRSLVPALNRGPEWSDRDAMESAIALAKLRRATSEAKGRHSVCGVCGRPFLPDSNPGVQRTCRECLDKGLRSPKEYGYRTCPQCGRTFRARSAPARFCSVECRNKELYMRRKAKRHRGRA